MRALASRIGSNNSELLREGQYPSDYEIPDVEEVREYAPIDLTPVEELDTYTETLRILRQRQLEHQLENERSEQERAEKMERHRRQMEQLYAQSDKDGFTYDYDGSLIVVRVRESDRSPLRTVEHRVKNSELSQQQKLDLIHEEEFKETESMIDDSLNEKRRGPPKPRIRKVEDSGGAPREIPIGWVPPNVMEKFNPAQGVTLIENERMRAGPVIEAKIDVTDTERIITTK